MDSNHESDLVDEALNLRITDGHETQNGTPHLNNFVSTRRVTSTQKKAHDITKHFTEAAKALGTGQLIRDDFFTLFEAVGALEIMDPKMDSGFLGPEETLEDDYDVLREVLPEEVVGIMDQLLCSEVAWHMGHNLPQTLFSSLYIDRLLWPEPKTLEAACFKRDSPSPEGNPLLHIVLRAYCLSLIKTCDYVHKTISCEIYYEEEDFVSNLYNWNLLSAFDTYSIIKLLEQAISFVNEIESLKRSIREAIVCRLEFRKGFLNAVGLEAKLAKQKHTSIWRSCLDLLSDLTKSGELGTSILECFSSKIQRRLASTVPPRPLISTSIGDAHHYLQILLNDGIAARDVLECSTGSQITNFVLVFQSRKPQPSTYIRCLLMSFVNNILLFPAGSSWRAQFYFNDLTEIVLPAPILVDVKNFDVEAPHDPRFQISEKMNKFVAHVDLLFLDFIRCLNMNRSRTRRMLCHIVYDWEVFQLDAEEVDVDLRELTREKPLLSSQGPDAEEVWSFPLSSWVYYHKLRQMEWVVQLGFELQIYQDSELAGMYWYLNDLSSTRLLHLQRIYTFTSRRVNETQRPSFQQTAAFNLSLSFLEFAMLEASATKSLADALSCLYISLNHLGLVATNPSPYSTPEFRYSLRMKPFNAISIPPIPSYQHYTSEVSPFSDLPPDPPLAIEEANAERLQSLLESADLATKIARKEWEAVGKASVESARCHGCEKEWREGQKNVLRSVIALGIAVAAVKKWVAEGSQVGKLKVEIAEKGYHDWWIVPKVKST
ncbi:hypothetical protein MMC30_007208 [Trapelia coarctata]|nr:hypothetical protein [Trapelia coarctata]